MGFRTSWIARHGTSSEELLAVCKLTRTQEHAAFADTGFHLLTVEDGQGGPWTIVVADGSDHYGALKWSMAQAVSDSGHDTCFFSCSDTVMASMLVCFSDKNTLWEILYDCSTGLYSPTITGEAPTIVRDVLRVLKARQVGKKGVDYVYDLPAIAGSAVVGFRHDEERTDEGKLPVYVLKPQ